MAFIEEAGTVVSFAEFQDVLNKDQRLFEANEGLSDTAVDNSLVRATERILAKFRSSDWWRSYYIKRDSTLTYNSVADVPALTSSIWNPLVERAEPLEPSVGLSLWTL